MFSLYHESTQLDMEIVDDPWMVNGLAYEGIVSPTIDLRGGSDPGNSALTGCSVRVLIGATKSFLFSCMAVVVGTLFLSMSWPPVTTTVMQ